MTLQRVVWKKYDDVSEQYASLLLCLDGGKIRALKCRFVYSKQNSDISYINFRVKTSSPFLKYFEDAVWRPRVETLEVRLRKTCGSVITCHMV